MSTIQSFDEGQPRYMEVDGELISYAFSSFRCVVCGEKVNMEDIPTGEDEELILSFAECPNGCMPSDMPIYSIRNR